MREKAMANAREQAERELKALNSIEVSRTNFQGISSIPLSQIMGRNGFKEPIVIPRQSGFS